MKNQTTFYTLIFTIAMLLVSWKMVNAQTLSPKVIPTNGGYASAGGTSLSWTLGETIHTTISAGGTILTQGEQQPEINLGNPLPVTLISFIAKKDESNTSVNLSWQTASEYNSAYFLIERSIDGTNFFTIGEHDAAGFSNIIHSYFFTDENPIQGINYYRLNQFDLNGIHEYSIIKEVSFSNKVLAVNIYPNPFTSSDIFITCLSQINNSELQIYNVLGEVVEKIILIKQLTVLETSHFVPGIYFYNVTDNGKTLQSGKLISH